MASGRSNQLTKQVGENLVAAELGRRGIIATTFAGNVPHFDILAADANGKPFLCRSKPYKVLHGNLTYEHFSILNC